MTSDPTDLALRQVSDLLNSGQVQAATQQLDALIRQDPNNDALLHPRMLIHAQRGEFDAAFDVALKLSRAVKQDRLVSFQIVQIAKSMTRIKFDADTENELCRLMEFPGLRCEPISELIYKMFLARAQACEREPDPIVACNASPIIRSALSNFWLKNTDIEIAVTRWRRTLLDRCAADIEAFAGTRELAAAIARQGYRNEYAFFVEPDEARQLEKLAERRADESLDSGEAASLMLALLMYRSPSELHARFGMKFLDNAALDPGTRELIADDVRETELLGRYSAEFAAEATHSSDTSAAVAQMYVESPYPRWVEAEDNTNMSALPYPDFYGLTQATAWDPASGLSFDTMLVAGCGTGWHPIAHAITFPWIQITAIDISSASLAYARLMAEKLGIANVRFEQADLLELGDRYGQFDVIESVGTLHHLERPEEGLRRLLRHLRPGGIFRLGLYSQLARQAIVRFRHDHPAPEKSVDAAFIRNLRHRFYVDDEFAPYRSIMEFGDFFSISGCRDLLLHPQESQFSIPDLQQLLAENALEFLTFSATDIMRFEMLGGQGSPYELANWTAVEQKETRLFNNMYQFFTQYHGPAA